MKFFSDELSQKEIERKKKPTRADYQRVKKVLGEFFIEIEVPDFPTVADLERWQRKTILGNS